MAWSLNLHHPYDPANPIDSLEVAARAINNIIGGATLTGAQRQAGGPARAGKPPANCLRYTGSAAVTTRPASPACAPGRSRSPAGQAALVADVYQKWVVGAPPSAAQDAAVLFAERRTTRATRRCRRSSSTCRTRNCRHNAATVSPVRFRAQVRRTVRKEVVHAVRQAGPGGSRRPRWSASSAGGAVTGLSFVPSAPAEPDIAGQRAGPAAGAAAVGSPRRGRPARRRDAAHRPSCNVAQLLPAAGARTRRRPRWRR